MKLFVIAAALCVLSFAAQAQNSANCPNFGQHAKTRPATQTAYTLSPNDQCSLLVFLNTGAEVVTLPKPGALFFKGWTVHTFSSGAGGITLTAAPGTTVNGGSTLARAQGTAANCYIADGGVWWCSP